MVPFKLLFLAFSLLSLGGGIAQAQPIANGGVACERIEKYTTEWFLQNTKPEYRRELVNEALFYSQGMSEVARKFARTSQNRHTTIWEVWPCYLYNHHNTRNNPMRCIHSDSRKQLTLFENMSRAFALKARNFATVMHSSANYVAPPVTGIWARIEFQTLQQGFVDQLEKINENKSMYEIFWRHARAQWRKNDWTKIDLKKRDPAPTGDYHKGDYGSCMLDKEYKVFEKIDW